VSGSRLASPGTVRSLLRAYGVQVKKRYGQNFLIDANILNRIVEAAELGPDDTVLEIGPGVGVLTEAMARRAGRVVAVEIDDQLVPLLRDVLAGCDNVQIVAGDALRIDLEQLVQGASRVKVVANLPYYVTSPLIMRCLEAPLPLERMVVMVQAEVADRLGAAPGTKEYGALTVAVQYRADVRRLLKVPRTVFFPRPNVDSAVVVLTMRPYPVQARDERLFEEVVRASFAQRRKTLRNALASVAGAHGVDVEIMLRRAGVDPGLRGESLTIEQFVALAEALAAAVK
jgi:16S rRNA (adenine1518-N6/adenine1519-N6)-dimethyltransferase